MAAKASLRDYQRELSARLQSAEVGRTASKLALQVGEEGWLVDLLDAGEVIPVAPISAVPLTRAWFKGVTNIRGNLYSVVDFSAFLGGPGVTLREQARLLLVSERFRIGSALLVDGSLGLRNAAQLQPRASAAAQAPWIKAEYTDTEGRPWKELDLPQLVQQPEFLDVGI
ncbi:MAG TPA: chemotaxis protein CheW [Burkholderiales bacterium]|nr:chemotaxis protein CheW [Burkholderiales bacterium]